MKLKHWQGYGTITAEKVDMDVHNGVKELHIRVTGEHEYGIACYDTYTVGNWLVRRFDKTFDNDPILNLDIRLRGDVCEYYITYGAKR